MQDLFFELIQMSLGSRDQLSRIPSEADWRTLYNEAPKHAIVGILLNGIEKLPDSQRPPQAILLQWIGTVQMVETTYVLQYERAKEMTKLFSAAGYSSSVLKGLGFSRYYPIPSRRQGGDIDLWINADRKELLRFLRSRYIVENVFYHHSEPRIFDDVETEIHYRPSWMYNPICNRRLQKWFENERSAQMVVDEKLGFAYPTVQFNAVYSLVHLYHHLIEEGVGIRHILDYYYILSFLPLKDRNGVVANLKRFEMMKLAGAMMWVLQVVCGMSSDYLICEPNEKEGRFLLDEIMRGGNFGKYRRDNLRRNTVARMFILLPHYPSEVLWVVPWKLWHKVWRMVNK